MKSQCYADGAFLPQHNTVVLIIINVGVKLEVLFCISYCLASVSPVDFCLPWNNVSKNVS